MRKCLFRSGVDLCVITSILSRSIKIRVRWHALDQSCRSTEEPLEEERQLDLKLYPERYDHIWEGEYAKAFEGAYFANHLPAAKAEGRIGHVGADPVLPYRAFFDLGGSGARADALAIWIVQFVGREIRVLDYIEGVGQEVSYYIAELRKRKYDQALLVLPHDGNSHHGPISKTYKDHFQDAGFEVDVIPNQGPGAAMLRIEAARRVFFRVAGSTKKPPKLAARRLAITMSARTKRAISASGLNTIGPHTVAMLSD